MVRRDREPRPESRPRPKASLQQARRALRSSARTIRPATTKTLCKIANRLAAAGGNRKVNPRLTGNLQMASKLGRQWETDRLPTRQQLRHPAVRMADRK